MTLSLQTDFYILESDRKYAESRIEALAREIQDLGPQFHVVLTQSNETWHDNAPFDALREYQSVLVAEQESLKSVLRKAILVKPKANAGVVAIGCHVKLAVAGKEKTYIIAGHWTYRAGVVDESGATVISASSPLAQLLLGCSVGDDVELPPKKLKATIVSVTPINP